jgi:hypothetical protein
MVLTNGLTDNARDIVDFGCEQKGFEQPPAPRQDFIPHCTAALPAAAVGADQFPSYFVDNIIPAAILVAPVEDDPVTNPGRRGVR